MAVQAVFQKGAKHIVLRLNALLESFGDHVTGDLSCWLADWCT